MTENAKMAKSLFVATIIGWLCGIGLVLQPWVFMKARALLREPALLPAERSQTTFAWWGSLVYIVLAGLGILAFIAMLAVSAASSP